MGFKVPGDNINDKVLIQHLIYLSYGARHTPSIYVAEIDGAWGMLGGRCGSAHAFSIISHVWLQLSRLNADTSLLRGVGKYIIF